jgi:hypothetical protein
MRFFGSAHSRLKAETKLTLIQVSALNMQRTALCGGETGEGNTMLRL